MQKKHNYKTFSAVYVPCLNKQSIEEVLFCLQMIAEESQVRLEMQMAMDSKDSDIERLRCQITSLSIHSLDTTSISSTGNDLEGEDYPGNYPGYVPSSTGLPVFIIIYVP